jgi:hypothetical protein
METLRRSNLYTATFFGGGNADAFGYTEEMRAFLPDAAMPNQTLVAAEYHDKKSECRKEQTCGRQSMRKCRSCSR